jgi:hypothetical protein
MFCFAAAGEKKLIELALQIRARLQKGLAVCIYSRCISLVMPIVWCASQRATHIHVLDSNAYCCTQADCDAERSLIHKSLSACPSTNNAARVCSAPTADEMHRAVSSFN